MKRTPLGPSDMPRAYIDLVRMHPPRVIEDDVAYRNVMEIIDALTLLPRPSAGQQAYLETLSVLAEHYEAADADFDPAAVSPLEALRHLMAEHGMSASDLGRLLGDRALGPKILAGSRQLSKSNIRALCAHFGVSADLFL